MNKSKNPVLNYAAYERADIATEALGVMTLRGTINKTAIMLALVAATGVVGYVMPIGPVALVAFLSALVLGFVVTFKPRTSSVLGPIYAVLEGYFVGAFSYYIQSSINASATTSGKGLVGVAVAHAVPVAVFGTLITLGVMLTLYATRVIRVTETFRSIVIGATAAIAITYLVLFAVSFFSPNFVDGLAIFRSGPIGIGFSIFVIGLAAMNYLVDFDFIERGVQNRAPKMFEWYAAFGLTVTVVWMYLEILRLMRKLAGNR
ncbi:MAG: Bax inhibitor-1/YccA family protein [Armatimonadetes bacterium]|nr:Bax inhibitor-1/YccA family protein [Armatimonadota bacterium]